jgi:hypothetical protein
VRWEALEQWGDDVARIDPLTGGVGVNEVCSVRVNGHLAVGPRMVQPPSARCQGSRRSSPESSGNVRSDSDLPSANHSKQAGGCRLSGGAISCLPTIRSARSCRA